MQFELKKYLGWGALLGAAALASFLGAPLARAELVFENPPQSVEASDDHVAAQGGAETRGDEREALRQALSVSQKAQATSAAERRGSPVVEQGTSPAVIAATVPAPSQVFAPAPAASAHASGAAEVQNLSKTELMRRERVREEIKNEDVLQERLEELRLRDERRRTEQLLGAGTASAEAPRASSYAGPASPAVVQEEFVTAPVTERSGAAVVPPAAPLTQQDQVIVSRSAASAAPSAVSAPADEEEKTRVSLIPRAGMSNVTGNTGFSVKARYAAGLAASIGVAEDMGFEVSYTYSEFGLTMNAPDWSEFYYYSATGSWSPAAESQAMKQNVVDAGLKLHLLGSGAKVRPFLGGGAAYSKSFVNYDQRLLDYLYQVPGGRQFASDYEISSFLGYLSTGLDVRFSKSVTVSALFKYYAVLSSRENHALNYAAFGNGFQNAYYAGAYGGMDYEANKRLAGGTLAKSNFYSILGGVSFTF